jgi:hypothetical protein
MIVIMLNVTMLCVTMLIVVAPLWLRSQEKISEGKFLSAWPALPVAPVEAIVVQIVLKYRLGHQGEFEAIA